jgi:hypothetical protein
MFERMCELEVLAEVDPLADEAALVDRIALLERVKAAAAAGQARAAAALDTARRAREAEAGVPAAKRGRGLASEVALARRDSPNCGGKHLGLAKALVFEMPHTLRALEQGRLSEWRATLIVRESACLSVEHRRQLDAELCADLSRLDGKGDKAIEAAAKSIAYRLDPQAVVDRATRAPSERRVTCRPAPDTMVYLTALLPVAKGVAVYAALKHAADTTFDGRSRGQVMADTLVERVTGTPADVASPVAVKVVISDRSLFAGDPEPADLAGYGPIPAAIARRMITAAATDPRSVATLRRLYRRGAALVAMDSRARRFPKGLTAFIATRDHTCRTPYCDAPIRHIDHAHPHHNHGRTSATNGQGLCERCNYDKEAPGWHVTTSDRLRGHTAEFVTPTGTRYRSTAPPPPGTPAITVAEIAARVTIDVDAMRCRAA